MNARTVALMIFFSVFCWSLVYASPTKEEKAATPSEPKYGGTLTSLGRVWSSTPTANPHTGTSAAWFASGPVFERLIEGDWEKYGPRGSNDYHFSGVGFIPEKYQRGHLAERWEITKDKMVFYIRPGIMWTGNAKLGMAPREFIADDAVASMTDYANTRWGKGAVWASEGGEGNVTRIYARDKYTMVMETDRFNAYWLDRIVSSWGSQVLPPEFMKSKGSWDEVVGTGPFILQEWVDGSHYKFKRNPNYWWKATIDGVKYQTPFVDTLMYPTIQDVSTRLAALRTGKVDLYCNMPLEYEESLAKTTPQLVKRETVPSSWWELALMSNRPPFSNKQVRRAMMMALDLPSIMKALFKKGEYYGWPVGPEVASFTPMDKLPKSARELWSYNPDEAKRLLAEAGYPRGFQVRGLAPSTSLEQQDLLNMVGSYWAKIGVDLKLLALEPTAASNLQFDPKAEYEVTIRTGGTIWPPAKLKNLYTGEMWNFARYSDPKFDQLYDKALATLDETERDAIFKELNVLAIDSASFIPIGGATTLVYWWPWVKNYYGEVVSSFHTTAGLEAAIWIDQQLKSEMGYK